MKKIFLSLTIISALLISSCGQKLTVTKKYHSFGWNIAFESDGKNDKKAENEVSKRKAKTVITEINEKTQEAELAKIDIEKEATQSNSSSAIKSNSNVVAESKIAEVKNTVSTFKTKDQTANLNVSKKQMKKAVKNILDKKATNETDTLILVLLILLVPFGTVIAMYLYEGSDWTSRVTTNLILTLLCVLPGVIHALITILGKK